MLRIMTQQKVKVLEADMLHLHHPQYGRSQQDLNLVRLEYIL